MQHEPSTFWGKLERDHDGRVVAWHPLVDHCCDVAAVAEALLCLPVWRSRLAKLAGGLISEIQWARLCVLAALHDIGKFNLGFQAKARTGSGPMAGHVREAVGALTQSVFSPLSELEHWGSNVAALLIASLCHHGRPYNYREAEAMWQRAWWQPRGGLDPQAGLMDLLSLCRQWFPMAFERDESQLPDSPTFAHAFAGVVMLADWIGSDTRLFPFTKEGDGDRMGFARYRGREALQRMGLDIAQSAREDDSGRDVFTRIAPSRVPRRAQAAMLTLPLDVSGSITILEAETGSGKTEAALARFVALFEAGLVDGLYFALPTRSAATQMHRRVRAAAQHAFPVPPPVVLAVPGYLRVDELEGTRLAPFEVQWTDLESERLRYRTWAAENSKRYLAGAIAVGTIDQVLLSSLMVGHAHLRATALLRHLLVVDEVHASDTYMGRVLEDVLQRHHAAGGHALLLSATLGGEARTRLLAPGKRATFPTIAQAISTPYPLVSHNGDGQLAAVDVGVDNTDRAIELTTQQWLDNVDALARAAVGAAREGAKVLVIRNTVRDCVATQRSIEHDAVGRGRRDLLFSCDGVPAPHHSRFARDDREALDKALEKRFGAVRPDGGCVLAATQTVQQSLDIDCDVLFSDICPADVLLQRFGRLHRHARARPAGFENPRAFIIVPETRDLGILIRANGSARGSHGLGNVYPDLRVIEATWRLVVSHPTWRIPDMNRYLVERSIHSSVLAAIVQEHGGMWQTHALQVLGTQLGEARLADLNLIDRNRSYAEMSFPAATEQRVPTRLGEYDRLVRFETTVTGPFGRALKELTVPAFLARRVPADAEFAEKIVRVKDGVQFTLGWELFVYDRLGLRTDVSPQETDDDGP